jgi:hypothetical protein
MKFFLAEVLTLLYQNFINQIENQFIGCSGLIVFLFYLFSDLVDIIIH